MNTPLKLVWKFDSCLDLNTPWIWTETWFKQASSWVKTKIWWWKCDYPAEISYIVDISLPEISCVFQMFTFVTSCCSPHISTSQQKSSTECLIWCHSGCVRILPFDRLRELCLSTVSFVVIPLNWFLQSKWLQYLPSYFFYSFLSTEKGLLQQFYMDYSFINYILFIQ